MARFTITFRRAVAFVLMPIVVAGCHTWIAAEDVAPQTFVETKQPSRVRVKTADGGRVEISAPRVVGDSLMGRLDGDSVAIALAEVTQVETRQLNPVTTAMAVLLVGVLVTALIVDATCSGSDFLC